MRPLRVVMENFQSFSGRTEIDLSGIERAVVVGPNGAGKSTAIVDAPLFAMFGECRGGTLASVVTYGEALCRVEYVFLLNGQMYLVARQYSVKGGGKSTLTFMLLDADGQPTIGPDGKPITLDGNSIAETEAKIQSVTGLTAGLLKATAISMQDDDASRFGRAQPTDRRRILGNILGLGHFETLAKAARDKQKLAMADRGSKDAALQAAAAAAAAIPVIEEQLALVGLEVMGIEKQRAEGTKAIDALGAEREETVRAQAQDLAARKELMDLRSRQTTLTADEGRAKVRVENLAFQVAGAGDTLVAIEEAEAAEKASAVADTRQKERTRLRSEATVLAEKVQGAKATHASSLLALETAVATARKDHEREAYSLGIEIDALATREELLSDVPCTDTPMAEKCPLIEDAMRARTLLPSKRQELVALAGQTPWAEQESERDALLAEEPWKADVTELARLKAAYDAIEYDAAVHAEAKADAAKLPELQKSLAAIEAAQAQIPEAQQALERAQAELKQVSDGVTALETELGQMPDWPAKLTRIDSERAAVHEQHARLGRSLDVARQNQGALTERLEAANKAAEQVKALEQEIADLDRHINILKILSNPHDGAFSLPGIPALLVEQAVPELEAAANEILDTLSDGRMSLALRTQQENKSGEVAESLEIVVLSERGEREYGTFSGGEKTRADIGLRAGLSRFLAKRAGARCELFVLDEPSYLDERGQDELIQCIGKLQTYFSPILLVTHLDRLKESLPVRLQVSLDAEGLSNVEVIYQ